MCESSHGLKHHPKPQLKVQWHCSIALMQLLAMAPLLNSDEAWRGFLCSHGWRDCLLKGLVRNARRQLRYVLRYCRRGRRFEVCQGGLLLLSIIHTRMFSIAYQLLKHSPVMESVIQSLGSCCPIRQNKFCAPA